MSLKKKTKHAPELDEQKLREIIEHYDNQTEEEAAAEDESFRRRANELRRQKHTEREIDEILMKEANELSKSGEPKRPRRQLTTLKLTLTWVEKAKFLAMVHNFADYRDWITQIVKERLELEDKLYRKIQKDAKSKARNSGKHGRRSTTHKEH